MIVTEIVLLKIAIDTINTPTKTDHMTSQAANFLSFNEACGNINISIDFLSLQSVLQHALTKHLSHGSLLITVSNISMIPSMKVSSITDQREAQRQENYNLPFV